MSAQERPKLTRPEVEELLASGTLFAWKKSSVRSTIWNHWVHVFAKDQDEASFLDFVQCNKCKKVFSHSIKTGNAQIIDHNASHARDEKELSLSGFVQTEHERPISNSDLAALKGQLCNFVASTFSPFSIVEEENFRLLLQNVFNLGKKYNKPNFKLNMIGRKSLKQSLMKSAESLKQKMKSKALTIKQQNLTLSTDIWSDKSKLNSFIDVSVIFVEGSSLKNFQYKMEMFSVAHTGENISNFFIDIADELNIEPRNLRIISDSAANMLCGLKLFNNFRCAAHRLHTVISDGIILLNYCNNNFVAWDIATSSNSLLGMVSHNVNSVVSAIHKSADVQIKLPVKIQWGCGTRPWRGLMDRYDSIIKCWDSIPNAIANKPCKKFFELISKSDVEDIANTLNQFSHMFDNFEKSSVPSSYFVIY